MPGNRLGGAGGRWRLVGLGLAALEVAYALGANLFLSTNWHEHVLDRKPEKLLVRWTSAWTAVPGVVHLSGLSLRGQTRTAQWLAEIERATVVVALPALARKTFRTHGALVHGLDFRLRRRLDAPGLAEATEPELAARAAQAPDIPGFANPPSPAPESLYPPRPKRPWRWTIGLANVVVRDAQRIWLDRWRLEGPGRVAGSLRYTLRGPLEVGRIVGAWRDASLTMGSEPFAEQLTIDVDGHLTPFLPREQQGLAFLDFATGDLDFAGRLADLPFLDAQLGGLPSLAVVDGRGHCEADLQIRAGILEPGSRLRLAAEAVSVHFLDYSASGAGTFEAAVAPAAGAPRTQLDLLLSSFSLRRMDAAAPHVVGENLHLTARATELRLSRPAEDIEAVIELPPSSVSDVRFYNAYLPERFGLELLRGTASLSGRVEVAARERTIRGELALASRDLELRAGDLTLTGELAVDTRLAGSRDQPYDASGSRLTLSRAELRETGKRPVRDWQAEIELTRAELVPGEAREATGEARARMTDARPLWALLEERRAAARWLAGIFEVGEVTAHSGFAWDRGSFSLRDLELLGGSLEVLGDLEVAQGSKRGVLYLRLGKLDAGLELRGTQRDWHLLHPRQWFEARRRTGA